MEQEGNKKRETRLRIMSAGKKLFTEKGFKDSQIIDIAKELGMDRRTIYRYYPSKEHILMHITSELFSNFALGFEQLHFSPGLNGFQKIEKLFERYYLMIEEDPAAIVFLGMVDINVGNEMYERDDYIVLDQYGKRMDAVLTELIEEGQKDGSVNTLFEPYEYAITFNNSLIAMATRISIYRPNAILMGKGVSWKILLNQGKILLDSMKANHD